MHACGMCILSDRMKSWVMYSVFVADNYASKQDIWNIMKCYGTIGLSYIVRCACALQPRRQNAYLRELLDDRMGQRAS